VLRQRYPAETVDAVPGASGPESGVASALLRGNVYSLHLTEAATDAITTDAKVRVHVPATVEEAAQKDQEALLDRWTRLKDLLRSDASADELAPALRPFIRRVFLSPRVQSALRDRLGGGP